MSIYPMETKEDAEERNAHPLTFAPERMSVKLPEVDVPMGNAIDLTLTFATGTLIRSSLGVMQAASPGRNRKEADQLTSSRKTVNQDNRDNSSTNWSCRCRD